MRVYFKSCSLLILILLLFTTSIAEARLAMNQNQVIKQNQKSKEDIEVTDKVIDDYWKSLKKEADELYKGLDISVEVLTGLYEGNEYKGEIKVKVPLYSKEEKRKKEEQRRNFLDEGAELIRDLEIKTKKIKILREKEIMLKAVMLDRGGTSIDAYHDVREDIAEVEAEIDEAVRKLEIMID